MSQGCFLVRSSWSLRVKLACFLLRNDHSTDKSLGSVCHFSNKQYSAGSSSFTGSHSVTVVKRTSSSHYANAYGERFCFLGRWQTHARVTLSVAGAMGQETPPHEEMPRFPHVTCLGFPSLPCLSKARITRWHLRIHLFTLSS
jgi:hypothetical protein